MQELKVLSTITMKGAIMADGILCKHCGWQESDHDPKFGVTNPSKRLKGYRVTIAECPGFKGETEPEALSDFEMQVMERRARGRHGWGMFAACQRLENLKSRMRRMDDAIRRAPSSEDKEQAEEAKRKFVDDCQGSQGFYVG